MSSIASDILLVLLCVSALIALGVGSLESRIGVTRYGIGVGKPAPTWPMLVFADQKLAVFQDLPAGLNRVNSSDSDIEVLLIGPRSKVN